MKLNKNKPNITDQNLEESTKSGFTIIEVMLVLGLTGLLLVGLLGGTFSAIKAQRYNDSVRSFAEYLRTVYSEVISPESLGVNDSEGDLSFGNRGYAILGKILVFGENYGDNASSRDSNRSVYSATIVGKADIPSNSIEDGFLAELNTVEATLVCGDSSADQASTVTHYLPLWEAELVNINDSDQGLNTGQRFSGSLIIARSPASGAVHTVYTPETYNLRDQCQPDSNAAAQAFRDSIKNYIAIKDPPFRFQDVGFCVKSENSAFMREVRLASDGRNTSAVSILNVDVTELNGVEVRNRCQ